MTDVKGDNLVRINEARNIRRWGTTRGLGELVSGPLANTVLDLVGTVLVPKRAIIAFIPCARNW